MRPRKKKLKKKIDNLEYRLKLLTKLSKIISFDARQNKVSSYATCLFLEDTIETIKVLLEQRKEK